MRRGQMLVSHFDTYSNGVKTVYKPKPNSQGMPYISHTQKYVKLAFLSEHFQLSFEPMFMCEGTQYLRLKVRWTPTPKVILVPHIIPNNLANYCSAQLSLYKKLCPKHQKGAWLALGGAYESLCVTIV